MDGGGRGAKVRHASPRVSALSLTSSSISPAPLLWEQAIDATLFDLFKYGTFEFEATATEIILLAIFCILRLPIGTASRTTVLNEPELALRELLSGEEHSRNASNIHFMGIDLALKLAGDLNIVTLPPYVNIVLALHPLPLTSSLPCPPETYLTPVASVPWSGMLR